MADLIKPDLTFIDKVIEGGGTSLKKCFQCATCSVICSLSPDKKPFPRKEMIWASWGLKKRLMVSSDIWLCYQCGDCTAYCPRGAKPSEVLSSIRKIAIFHYAFPSFLAKILDKPKFLPFLILISSFLLGLSIFLKDPLENLLGLSPEIKKIIYPSTPIFPRWLLNSIFLSFSIFTFILSFVSVIRFFLAIKRANPNIPKAKSLWKSIFLALKEIITHNNFLSCTINKRRFLSHSFVFFGFIALFIVGMWVMTAGINPIFQKGFIYPFNLLNPLKIMANLGGLFLIAGCLIMLYERFSDKEKTGTYFDLSFILMLLFVATSGFATELLHYLRIDFLRYILYFFHLSFVLLLFLYLPYSKFAHFLYRTIAMIYSEYYGRKE